MDLHGDERTLDGRLWRSCCACQARFYLTAAAQAAFALKQLSNPTRCYQCRTTRRLAREIAEHEMENE